MKMTLSHTSASGNEPTDEMNILSNNQTRDLVQEKERAEIKKCKRERYPREETRKVSKHVKRKSLTEMINAEACSSRRKLREI